MAASCTVLIVEDDFLIRTCLAACLQDHGLDVQEATCLKDIETVFMNGATFDVLITDFNLPDGTGTDVATLARQHQSTLPVICISGDTQTVTQPSLFECFFIKPYVSEKLLGAVTALIQKRQKRSF